MRVGINLSWIGGGRTGIGRYSLSLLDHLLTDSSNEYTVLQWRKGRAAFPRDLPRHENVHYAQSRIPGRIQNLLEVARFPVDWTFGPFDVFFELNYVAPPVRSAKTLVAIYDLGFLKYGDLYNEVVSERFARNCVASIRRAGQIFTLSAATKQDLLFLLSVTSDRISVVPPGCDLQFRPLPLDAVEKYRQRRGLPTQFLLFCGHLLPWKQVPRLVRAFQMIADRMPGYSLVLSGPSGGADEANVDSAIAASCLGERVRRQGYVPDDEMPWLMNAATALVTASLSEGFHLPLLEAMACGTPVAASQIPVFREVCDSAAVYFDPHDEEAIAQALLRITDPEIQARLPVAGLQQAATFSWDRSVRLTLEAFEATARGLTGN